jgi:hypothetical protein
VEREPKLDGAYPIRIDFSLTTITKFLDPVACIPPHFREETGVGGMDLFSLPGD